VRRFTRCWIAPSGGRGSEGGDLGAARLTWTGNRKGTAAWRESAERSEGVEGAAVQGPRDTAKARLLEAQSPAVEWAHPATRRLGSQPSASDESEFPRLNPSGRRAAGSEPAQGDGPGRLRHARHVQRKGNAGSPTGREPYGDGGFVVVVGVTPDRGGRESRPQGEGTQVSIDHQGWRGMRNAERRSRAGDHP
jgi:hypothetical protein